MTHPIRHGQRTPGERHRVASLLVAARREFGRISPADRRVVRAAALGEDADFLRDDPDYVEKFARMKLSRFATDRLNDARDFEKDPHPVCSPAWRLPTSATISASLVRWLLMDAEADRLVHARGVWIFGAAFEDTLDLEGCTVTRSIILGSCNLRAGIDLLGARCQTLYLGGPTLYEATMSGGTRCALRADGAKFTGDVFLRNGFRAEGAVSILGASIGGDLVCSDGHFHNPGGKAFNADRAKIAGSAFLRDGFRAEGEVNILSASIGGNLECSDGRFINPGGKAINADGAKITGGVFLRDDFHAEGEVRHLGATIGGDLACSDGRFINPGGKAISADGAKITGGVFLLDDFRAEGEVRILGATIGGYLDCSDGYFHNPGGKAINANGANIRGMLFLRGVASIEGLLDLASASVGTLVDAEADNDGAPTDWPKELLLGNFRYKEIHSGAPLSARERLRWLDNYDQTLIRNKYHPPGTQPDPQPYRQLAKVMREQGHEGDARAVMRALGWRRLKPLAKRHLRQPIEKLHQWTPVVLLIAAASAVSMWMARDGLDHGIAWYVVGYAIVTMWFTNSWEWVTQHIRFFTHLVSGTMYGLVVGHGYSRWRPLIPVTLFILFGAAIFGSHSAAHIQPSQGLALRDWQAAAALGWTPTPNEPSALLSWSPATPAQWQAKERGMPGLAWVADYPGFNSVVYSADVFLPLVSFHQEEYWTPAGGPGWFGWLVKNVYLPLHIMMGWVVATLFVASFTGLMRRDE